MFGLSFRPLSTEGADVSRAQPAHLNPDPNDLPVLDPEDASLLLDPLASPAPYSSNDSNPVQSTPPHVPWLRRTEYLSREVVSRSSTAHESRLVRTHSIDVSRAAQLLTIDASFAACN